VRPERWERIQTLFDEACDLDAAARAKLFDERCAGDPELRREVESLLARAAGEDDRLGAIVGAGAESLGAAYERALAGRLIGSYRVIERIGHGGMGAVYLAERADEQFEKRVAIKVVRDTLARPGLAERFRAERQILASLEHPNIARLIDGGELDDGTPYVVMEYVEGAALDAHCESAALSMRERLELFCVVCDAVHHAHRNLVVHRDIKPSNILVNTDGVPKLLDFGIAKLMEADTAEMAATLTAEVMLTPDYASPEQIRAEAVTTATDVYSLGVVLYLLLTGSGPYRSIGTTPAEHARAVCEQEPERPSRATTAGAKGSHEARRRRSALAGDLDNIVLMALRKEPERRYATSAQLAEDIRRYLDGEPVAARSATWTYRTSKFVGRNRALVAALAAGVLLLIAGTITATTLAISEARQRAEAQRQAEIANAVNRFLNEDLLAQADPYNEPDRDITLREVVDRAAERVEERFEDQPVVRAAVRYTLGETYENLGDFEAAEVSYRSAAELRETSHGAGAPETLAAWNALAGTLFQMARDDETAALLESKLPILRSSLGDDHPLTLNALNTLALVYDAQGRPEMAIDAYFEAIEAHRRVFGVEDPETLTAMNNLALIYSDQGRYDEAEPLLVEILDVRRRALGNEHPDTILSLASLGFHHTVTGEFGKAEPLLREAAETGRRVLGSDHHWQTNNLNLLADLYRRLERYDEAEPLFLEAIESQRRTLGDDHPLTLRSMSGLIWVYANTGRNDRAEEAAREVLRYRVASVGDSHPQTLGTTNALAAVLREAGRPGEALVLLEKTLPTAREVLSGDSRVLGLLLTNHGRCLDAVGRAREAGKSLEEGYEVLVGAVGPDDEETRAAARALAEHYERLGRTTDAAEWREKG